MVLCKYDSNNAQVVENVFSYLFMHVGILGMLRHTVCKNYLDEKITPSWADANLLIT